MSNIKPNDSVLREILKTTRVIAVVGHSDKPHRSSYQIAQFLRAVGYNVYPVNPAIAQIDRQPCYPSLQAVPETVELVNVFRRSQYLNDIVDEALAIKAQTVWAQLGIEDRQAAQKAIAAGLNIVMNACIKVEYLHLFSAL
jgi:predicted CoA-binding protein